MHNYDIFVAKIYDYALIDSFSGSPGLIDSPTSYATLIHMFGMNEDTSNYSHPNENNESKNSSNSLIILLASRFLQEGVNQIEEKSRRPVLCEPTKSAWGAHPSTADPQHPGR